MGKFNVAALVFKDAEVTVTGSNIALCKFDQFDSRLTRHQNGGRETGSTCT